MALPRTILHVDMDAFFASVEQRDHPEWRGKPVIVGAGPNERGVVSTCSYEARAYGVRSAMPSRTAAKLCPDGIFVPPDFKRYKAASDGLMAILGSFTPCVEPLSLDEAFLDVTGSRRLFGDGVAIAEAIRARVKEELRLTCSVGVAKNMFLAKLASDLNKPDGLTVVPREPEALAAFLAPLPVSRLWGAGPKAVAALARGPIRTFGELLAADGTYLAHLVGKNAAAFFRALARGEDDREVAWEGAEAKSISRETTFPEDERDWGKVEGALRELAEDVARRLRLDGRYAKTARLKIRWGDFETWTRQRPFAKATRLARDCREAADALLAAVPRRGAVRLVGFGVERFSEKPESSPRDLFGEVDRREERDRKEERLEAAVDEIRRKLGKNAIRPADRLDPPPKGEG